MLKLTTGVDPTDLDTLADIATAAQAQQERHVAYLGTQREGIRAEIDAIEDWAARTSLARSGDTIVGWLLADFEPDMGRVWWHGPFVRNDQPWREVADALYAEARGQLPPESTEEAAGDVANVDLAAWAEDHGLAPATPSAALRIPAPPTEIPTWDVSVLTPGDAAGVVRLHGILFDNAHLTPEALVEGPGLRWVVGRPVVGYLAAEIQPDGVGYIDFVGVDPDHRRQGVGRALVVAACRQLFDEGVASIHLTVRTNNIGAHALYTALGFVEECRIRPYRAGFSVAEDSAG